VSGFTEIRGTSLLPADVTVLERGWLSSNTVLLRGRSGTAIVDSGYWTHSAQTVELVSHQAGDGQVTTLVNTHLHSDHCGGNSALQARWPALRTLIPPGLAASVRAWDPVALTYTPTGQECPRFRVEGTVCAGEVLELGDLRWHVHAAPGHDAHSIVLFEAGSRTLISADALWQNGFGVVFQELEGAEAFSEVGATLDLIERLAPKVVIPGHGAVFADVSGALARARSRLEFYLAQPEKHAAHAAKVLMKFKLLELQTVLLSDFMAWADRTPYFAMVRQRWFAEKPPQAWLSSILSDLVRSGAARLEGGNVLNA
jgi:glyoxylase-like metal-dependent hydrolase (beta-lactamase superfamily II)